ncbi:regulatory particle non-ATPase 10 [Dermatophagoides farinae]|uniref:26S proteasome non-ATPase regulatory subunit 4 n=3 Tax=Pyroglyphidae TaxID=6952 RepID=A0A9D4P2W7_DERFA|nr:26S proteasome non-ATPase regulatory subunit 4-like [Dermatophagoides farinae]KAH7642679.1 26s proteasome non-atpase regulatory subunit 4-like protein [Dermatophagoides farinae]
MVLESTIVCVDNSEFMRNGDFVPSRLQAQQDAVSLVCHAKLRSNPENNVALLTMAGNPQVLTTLTTDVGRVLGKLHQVQISGEANLLTGIKIAHLALKHRQGKNHKMRIVAFIGSPVETEERELIKIAKKLKKEKVNVDIVNFGEEISNTDKLYAFIKVLEGTSSHMVTVPSGSLLSDALFSSPVILGEDGSGAAGLGGTGFEFGIDPNEDPELALALRVSMEEQRQRQEEEARQQAAATSASGGQSSGEQSSSTAITNTTTTSSSSANNDASKTVNTKNSNETAKTTTTAAGGGGSNEEEMLEKALAMSLEPMDSEPVDVSRMTEDEQIQYAMQMSLQASSSSNKNDTNKDDNSAKNKKDKEEPMDTDDSNDKK